MKQSNLILILLLLIHLKVDGQFDSCLYVKKFDGQICYRSSHKQYENVSYYDVVQKMYPNDILKREDLLKFELQLSNSIGQLHAFENVFRTYIEFQTVIIPIDTTFDETGIKYLDEEIFIKSKLNGKAIGTYNNIDNQASITTIKQITICYKNEEIIVPDSLYDAFINPNLNRQLYSLRPIEVFTNKNFDHLYFYFMGDIHTTNDGKTEIIHTDEASYITKIVVDVKNSEFKMMWLSSNLLYDYCWPLCVDFWPF
ncbi:MAG TPA: hypothetical protein PLZ32_18495 [Saprospiraceae bacterium]|nr:hypothetical protein [Saprospiraceae bacterium]